MNAKQLVSIGLVSILWLGSPIVLGAQSNWPTSPKPTAATPTPPAKSRKPAAKKRRKARKSTIVRVDEATLRTFSDLIARQTLAIEALTLRLEATERRLEQAMLPTAELTSNIADPFLAPVVVDWAKVVEELGQ